MTSLFRGSCVALILLALAPLAAAQAPTPPPGNPTTAPTNLFDRPSDQWHLYGGLGFGAADGKYGDVLQKPLQWEVRIAKQSPSGAWRFGVGLQFGSMDPAEDPNIPPETEALWLPDEEWARLETSFTVTRVFNPRGTFRPYLQGRLGIERIHPRSALFYNKPPDDLEPGESPTKATNGIGFTIQPGFEVALSKTVSLDVASLSHPGMVRSHNEDTVFVDAEAGLAVLADGMGGYNAGEVASGIAVNVVSNGLLPELRGGRELSKVDVQSGLTHAALLLSQNIAAANKGIYEAAQARPECAGMGTTIVAALFHGNRVSIGHIGDSRCYRLRGEKFEQLTHDHSLLQEQIDSGQLTKEQAKYSLNKNLVTRALGIEAIVPADISEYRLEADDVYLLCSDGLTDMVEPEIVQGILQGKRTELPEAAADLVELANQNGGRDNISVILVRVPQGFLPASGWAQRFLAKRKAGG